MIHAMRLKSRVPRLFTQRASKAENVSIWWRHHGAHGVNTALESRCVAMYDISPNLSLYSCQEISFAHNIYLSTPLASIICSVTSMLCAKFRIVCATKLAATENRNFAKVLEEIRRDILHSKNPQSPCSIFELYIIPQGWFWACAELMRDVVTK